MKFAVFNFHLTVAKINGIINRDSFLDNIDSFSIEDKLLLDPRPGSSGAEVRPGGWGGGIFFLF